ncbi:MAG: cytochrome P460 family protein [Deltaproteobacteria bacterium]|nr:cytochrome P460 family protein [Deltaproteobacteria bacterium]
MRALHLIVLLAACGDDAAPLFPESYASTYTEVRNCRSSSDHELNRVRVLADPAALAPYMARTQPFPVGSIVLKAEYDFGDTSCAGAPVAWTVMKKLATPEDLGWVWQKVDAKRGVESENDPQCIQCHSDCGVAPLGYDGTCTVP